MKTQASPLIPPSGMDLKTAQAVSSTLTRYLDLALILRRKKTGQWLLKVGGRWDRLRNAYDGKPKIVHYIDLEESQIEFTVWFAHWLADFKAGRPRETALAIAGGDRRGGKTFNLLLCTIAMCLEVPSIDASALVGWVVSCNYQERDEIDRTVLECLPSEWYSHRRAPEFRYIFANGATLRNVSADNPETLKRGRVDIVFYNEAQKIPVAALSNGIYGTVDKGGIALLAANPPRRQVGEWVLGLKSAIDEKVVRGAKFFGFSSKDNTQIDQRTRGQVGELLRLIDPKAALADDEGAWLPVGERAYPNFDSKKNLGSVPQLGEITAEYLRKRIGRAYACAGGVDFQGTPHHAGVICRIFGSADAPVYFFTDEILAEQSTEDDFLDEVDDRQYAPENLLWIGDASGQWQDGRHSLSGRQSFDIFKRRRWHIEPPRKKKSTRGEFSKNPDVDDRLNLVNKLLAQGRIVVDPATCPALVDALKDCPLKSINTRRKPYGRHSHISDALGYVLWWLEPRPMAARAGGPGVFTVPIVRRGSDVI